MLLQNNFQVIFELIIAERFAITLTCHFDFLIVIITTKIPMIILIKVMNIIEFYFYLRFSNVTFYNYE